MTERLSETALSKLDSSIGRPSYDRAAVKAGIVHLGLGAFHRGHQALVIDNMLAAGAGNWGIVGVSMRTPDVADWLAAQDGLYSITTFDGDASSVRVIGSVVATMVAPRDPNGVIALLSSPDINIVTLTITEKGYGLDPGTGAIALENADVAADHGSLAFPKTAAGFLVASLARRRAAGLAPFTVISCDNLPHNGARLKKAVLSIAHAHAPELAGWIEQKGAFPSTMVDRIVPAMAPDDIGRVAAVLGVKDMVPVRCEPYFEWIIEDRFAGPRPDFEEFGVRLTTDIAPWERVKLRMLNGAHSAMAYLGVIAGKRFVHEFVAEPWGAAFVNRLWSEVEISLDPPPEFDLDRHRSALMVRFANTALAHSLEQISVDGSYKIPQRILPVIVENCAAREGFDTMALAVAGWIRWLRGVDDLGCTYRINDPVASRLRSAFEANRPLSELVERMMNDETIFPPELNNRLITARIGGWLEHLETHGAASVLESLQTAKPAGH